jgi:excisionase family DNA binding protein
METEKLLTKEEVADFLNVSQEEVEELAKTGRLPAYNVGGMFLRFRKSQVEEFRKKLMEHSRRPGEESGQPRSGPEGTFLERIKDFFYFYDFYIISALVIIVIIFIILH